MHDLEEMVRVGDELYTKGTLGADIQSRHRQMGCWTHVSC